jgi:hypothetical protein
MTRKRRKKSLQQLAEEILSELHDIDQKVEHLIRRMPKNGQHHPHDPHWNEFLG